MIVVIARISLRRFKSARRLLSSSVSIGQCATLYDTVAAKTVVASLFHPGSTRLDGSTLASVSNFGRFLQIYRVLILSEA
jgi:hypothetical protein